jgi:hypothetical protein
MVKRDMFGKLILNKLKNIGLDGSKDYPNVS